MTRSRLKPMSSTALPVRLSGAKPNARSSSVPELNVPIVTVCGSADEFRSDDQVALEADVEHCAAGQALGCEAKREIVVGARAQRADRHGLRQRRRVPI